MGRSSAALVHHRGGDSVAPAPCRRFFFPNLARCPSPLARKEGGGVVVEDFLFCGGAERERMELGDVLGHLVYAGAGPVGAPEDFVGDVLEAGESLGEVWRRDAADVHMKILVAADEEESFGHPDGAAAVGEDDR